MRKGEEVRGKVAGEDWCGEVCVGEDTDWGLRGIGVCCTGFAHDGDALAESEERSAPAAANLLLCSCAVRSATSSLLRASNEARSAARAECTCSSACTRRSWSAAAVSCVSRVARAPCSSAMVFAWSLFCVLM